MYKNNYVLGAGVALLLGLAAYFYPDHSSTELTDQASSKQDDIRLLSGVEKPTNAVPTSQGQAQAMTDEPSLLSDEVKVQVNAAMQSYAEISLYPPSSQPIVSTAHLNSFVNKVTPSSSMPYPVDGLDQPVMLSMSLAQYNYFYGDTIIADIRVEDYPEHATVSARTLLMDSQGEIYVESGVDVKNDSASVKEMRVSFDTLGFDTSHWPFEMYVGAYVEVDGHTLFTSVPFRINTETATFDSVGYSQPNEEYLEIPVNLNVARPGYYFVSGVLFSATSKQPLIYLEAEGQLSEGLQSLVLNAHIQALKKGGDEGPYTLGDIQLERWSDEHLPFDISGKVPQPSYFVEGYTFDSFIDKPYVDPLRQERLDLMQGLTFK